MLAVGFRYVFYQLSGTAINFGPVINGLTLAAVTDATGTFNLYDPLGEPVPGAYNLAFTYTPSLGAGMYQAIINGSMFNPAQDNAYVAVVSLSSSTAGLGTWTNPATVLTRSQ
jgi:hypothetical protein